MTHADGDRRQVERPTYDDGVRAQIDAAVATAGGLAGDADLRPARQQGHLDRG